MNLRGRDYKKRRGEREWEGREERESMVSPGSLSQTSVIAGPGLRVELKPWNSIPVSLVSYTDPAS